MLPRNPLQPLVPPRLGEVLRRISHQVWTRLDVPVEVAHTAPALEYVNVVSARKSPVSPISENPFIWGPKWAQCWFRLQFSKEVWVHHDRLFLLWKDQAEGTLYHGDVPFAGLDVGRDHTPVPPNSHELWIESVCCNTGFWVPEKGGAGISADGSHFTGAFLVSRNDEAWEVFHDFDVLLRLLAMLYGDSGIQKERAFTDGLGYQPPIEGISSLFRRLSGRLDRAADILDTRGMGEFRSALKSVYEDFSVGDEANGIRSVLTGHAHLDLAWLWPERIGEFKAAHTFSNALRLMDDYPEFRFGYSQPASYEAVNRNHPQLLKLVRQKIESLQWEATGAFYVESDTQLPCGEALLRSLLLGQKGFRDICGKDSRVLWLPDVFGYSGCLPQLLKGVGVDWFFTTKLTWSNITRFPYSSFVWKGYDGSEVTTHIMQDTGYNGTADPATIRNSARNHRQADVHPEQLLPTGYGDGGGGPNMEMCERVRRMSHLAGLPSCQWGSIESFFERLEAVKNDLPTYQGEVYLEYHRGVQTTHGRLKKAFRACERALQVWEAAHCVSGDGPIDEQFWKRLVFSQFHDVIPGSSCWEVYEEIIPELENLAEQALKNARIAIDAGNEGRCFFNPLACNVTLPVNLDNGASGFVEIAPLSSIPLDDSTVLLKSKSVEISDRKMWSKRVSVSLDEQGYIEEFTVDGVKLDLRESLGMLYTFPDHPNMFDAWDIDRPALHLGKQETATAQMNGDSLSDGSAVFRVKRKVGEKSEIEIAYRLDPVHPVLYITYDVNWRDEKTLLKVAFPTQYSGYMARYGAPFGSVLRAQHPGKPQDEAAFEVPGSRWAQVSDDTESEGLFIVSEDKYGFGCQSGLLHMSLLRSAFVTDSHLDRGIRNLQSESDFSDMGKHTINLAIGMVSRHMKREEHPAALADILFIRPFNCQSSPESSGLIELKGGETLIPAWCKPVDEKQWVLRLHEVNGRRGETVLKTGSGYTARLLDFYDSPTESGQHGEFVIRFKPYQVLNIGISHQ